MMKDDQHSRIIKVKRNINAQQEEWEEESAQEEDDQRDGSRSLVPILGSHLDLSHIPDSEQEKVNEMIWGIQHNTDSRAQRDLKDIQDEIFRNRR